MKILQICPIFPLPPKAFASGVTNNVYNLSKELVERGHKVTIYTSSALDLRRRIQKVANPVVIDGIAVQHFPITASYYTFFVTPTILPMMRKWLRHFDIVHLHDPYCFQSIICHHYARKYNVPYVVQTHGSVHRTGGRRKLRWLLHIAFGHRILTDASRVFALTETEAQHMGP